jgi:prepilin-type processing-associated H-X9-DG protein
VTDEKAPILGYASPQPRRWTKGEWLLTLALVVAILLVVGLIIQPILWTGHRPASYVRCLSNLRNLGAAVMQYAQLNGGQVPPTLDALAAGLPGTQLKPIFVCAAASGAKKPPATVGSVVTSNYIYCPPGARLPTRGGSTTVLAYEPLTNHSGRGAAFLFCDGHAEWRTPATAAPLLAQVAARSAAPATQAAP